jgi:hypothetical protein
MLLQFRWNLNKQGKYKITSELIANFQHLKATSNFHMAKLLLSFTITQKIPNSQQHLGMKE